MQTRHRNWRADGALALLSTQAVIQATEAEVRKDLQRLSEAQLGTVTTLFEKNKEEEEPCGSDRRKGFRRGTKVPEEGMEAVLGLASLVIEAETRKRKRTIVKTVTDPPKPKLSPRSPVKPPKPVKDLPKKAPKPSPPTPPPPAKETKIASQPNSQLYPQVFPQQFPMPLFYPPLSLYQYQCFKYPPTGFFPPAVMNMYCGAQASTKAMQGVGAKANYQIRGQNAVRHVAIAKMIQQTEITAEDLLTNYKKSRLARRITNLDELERMVLELFGGNFQAIAAVSRTARNRAENPVGDVKEIGKDSLHQSFSGEDDWIPNAISRGKDDVCTPEPTQPNFPILDTLLASPITPKRESGNDKGAAGIALPDNIQLSRLSTDTTFSSSLSQHFQEPLLLQATQLPRLATPSHKHPIIRHKSTSRAIDHIRGIEEKPKEHYLSPLRPSKDVLIRKSSKVAGKFPKRTKSMKRKLILPSLAINGTSDILGAYGAGLYTNVRGKSLLRHRAVEEH